MLRPVRLTRGVPTTGALEATPTICVQQHDCVASLIGKASSENKGAGRIGVVPRIVLVVCFGVRGRVTSFLGGSSGGRQAIGHVAAVSTASSAAGHHMRPLELDHGSGALQVALQEALRELPEVPRPLPPCSYSTHGDDAPAQRTPCPGRGRGARMCDP